MHLKYIFVINSEKVHLKQKESANMLSLLDARTLSEQVRIRIDFKVPREPES